MAGRCGKQTPHGLNEYADFGGIVNELCSSKCFVDLILSLGSKPSFSKVFRIEANSFSTEDAVAFSPLHANGDMANTGQSHFLSS